MALLFKNRKFDSNSAGEEERSNGRASSILEDEDEISDDKGLRNY
jgi:hypothetical protein